MTEATLSTPNINRWIIQFQDPPPYCHARLICFHWAGGNGQAFRPWSKVLHSNGIDVRAMMLPGRLSRSSEKFITNIQEITG